ncbi:septal ring lytic transglycosylase RlpA family protein [Marinimicrobium sp. ABcell2]|uniref:septal ring lytic transglycosylase RlpA family protein n=1 Tax=Marinimicrobium sp. ABcell2 TaxID=3069751 RepID=UPI0027B183EF|nr:septal ring lytic transglycosylase RlpA family protein [Marinimicrobium sp. ABcell2]MDQ2076278.1 septal ring lytic transglycosylase RlpA family protein [Marinimicrobium sp. ABcell2]
MKHGIAGVLILSSLYLVGCSSLPTVEREPEEERDRGPAQPVDLSHVPDAVPRQEVRTRAGNSNPYTVLGRTYHLLDDETDYKERGIASWYGKKFHGRYTSNGEVYDMYAMTAAHKKLPIPSYVRVTNLDNGRSVVVRVNDRGPFHDGRIIDLSYAAAQRLGFVDQGTAPVEVEIIVPDGKAPAPLRVENSGGHVEGGAFLQVGAFSSETAARAQADRVSGLTDQEALVISPAGDDQLYRVRLGPFTETTQLHQVQELLRQGEISQAHIVYDR